ncbi:oxidoreductase [Sphingomonas abietis]|uniref:Oxidoreductase n=1 Tax=Sphingomonas abietis TaxID=3012344 RepID=A0ABY7NR61_9SPHN|nr:oxidoreductase [Sphingomonas abietis]WBO23295.1 oxidoreductase [Sphingomonas abietis]
MSDDTPVWFISGCSTGFGRELARLVLEQGQRAVITARGRDRIADLAAIAPDRALALDLDVTDQGQINAAVEAAETHFGRIDILVNNAGYGYQSSVEEGEEPRIRAQFDANVFGLFALTRAVLPIMRRQKSGHVINITSVGGLIGFASSGYYSATKHAIEGWSDALKLEVSPLGIQVTCVEPGPFRTDWAGRSLEQTQSHIPDYAETAAKRMADTSGYSGAQPGDPVRAAQTMIDIALKPDAPRHLVLGKFGYEAVTKRMTERLAEIEGLRAVSLAADFPEDEA